MGSWVLLLLPAIAGAILGLRGWPAVGLLVPGASTQLYLGYRAGREHGYTPRKRSRLTLSVEVITGLALLGSAPRDGCLTIAIGVILVDCVRLRQDRASLSRHTPELVS